MSTQTIKTTFKLRRGESQEWESKNPTLAEGEPAFEVDTGKLKIGASDNQLFNDAKYIQVDYEDIVNKRGIIPAYEFVYKDDGTVAKAGAESLVMYVGWDAGGINHYNKNKPRATSSNCLALGPYCEATYPDSAAFNYMGLAHAARSFACGRGTEVLGAHGAAFNRLTKAGGVNSAAFGLNTEAYGYCSAAFGQQTYVGIKLTKTTQNGITYYSIPTNAAGSANVITPLFATIANYNYEDNKAQPIDAEGNNVGEVINLTDPEQQTLRGIAFGHFTVANGENALATGYKSIAVGKNSIALGHSAQAQGENSLAFGTNISSIEGALFKTTVAVGAGSLAFGFGAIATSICAIALGDDVAAKGACSFASGSASTASGDCSAAFNDTSEAGGEASFAANMGKCKGSYAATFNGSQINKDGEHSFAINGGIVTNTFSFAGGGNAPLRGAKASGLSSFAFGYKGTEASASISVAFGYNTKATSEGAFAAGWSSTASGTFATAFNYQSTASGHASFACNKSRATAPQSFSSNEGHAEGTNSAAFNMSVASGEYSVAIGAANSIGNNSFAGGASCSSDSGEKTTTAEGRASLAFGGGVATTSAAAYATALGQLTIASAACAVALGNSTQAQAANTLATGYKTQAQERDSIANGYVSYAKGKQSLASGYYVIASGQGSAAFGMWNQTSDGNNSPYLLSVGNGTANNQRKNAFAVGNNFIEINGIRLTGDKLQALLALLQ